MSPPDGYKDGGALSNALGGALGGRVFGAQHIQQLQVIQRLQAQRAAMLAARATTATGTNATQVVAATTPATTTVTAVSPTPSAQSGQAVCTECAECAECAAKQMQDEGKFFLKKYLTVLVITNRKISITFYRFLSETIKGEGHFTATLHNLLFCVDIVYLIKCIKLPLKNQISLFYIRFTFEQPFIYRICI